MQLELLSIVKLVRETLEKMTRFLETWEGVMSKEAEMKAEAGQNVGRKLIIMGSRHDSFLVWSMRS